MAAYSPTFLADLRRRLVLSEVIGQRIKLVRQGREYVGLCPFHAERTPSFYVVEDHGFFHCFGCGAHGNAIDFVMRSDNLNFRTAVAKLASGQGAVAAAAPADGRAGGRREKDERNRRIALQLFEDAEPAGGTLVETYVRSRGVSLPPAPVLRFSPRCWNRESGRKLPAMLARVDDIDGDFLGVHRTWLLPDGSGKAELEDQKMSLGRVRGGAIRLAPAGPMLAVAEGIENALSATAVKGIPAWSAVAKGGFKSLQLPAEVREVLIVADHDHNGGGEIAARAAGQRWAAEGRHVRLWRSPQVGQDANDLLLLKEGKKGNVGRGSVASVRRAD
jgi:DNA primase